jgi:hypothetical protein
MTLLSSLSRSVQSQRLAPFVVAATLLLGACEDKHIGRLCDIGVDMVTDPKLITVNPQALECPSRVCILPAQEKTTDTHAFCTDECSSDDDCSDGERGTGANDFRCNQGFVCRKIVPKLENNPLSCKSVCVCKDFLMTPDPNNPDPPPPSCK